MAKQSSNARHLTHNVSGPTPSAHTSSENNGGSTDYYKIDPQWFDLQDVIEARNMNFAQGNILKAAFTFNVGRHVASSYERELNKIIWFASRELKRLKESDKADNA